MSPKDSERAPKATRGFSRREFLGGVELGAGAREGIDL
jgi:hypothetical protein